jgi:hypothetical protein
MNEWSKEQHNKSGLVQRVRDSTISLQEAEQQVGAAAGRAVHAVNGAACSWQLAGQWLAGLQGPLILRCSRQLFWGSPCMGMSSRCAWASQSRRQFLIMLQPHTLEVGAQ